MNYPSKELPAGMPKKFRGLPFYGTFFLEPDKFLDRKSDYPGLWTGGEFVSYESRWHRLCVNTLIKPIVDVRVVNKRSLQVGQKVWVEFLPSEYMRKWDYVQGVVLDIYDGLSVPIEEQNDDVNYGPIAQVRFRDGWATEDVSVSSCITYEPPGLSYLPEEKLPDWAVGWCHYCGSPAKSFDFFDSPVCRQCGGS